MSETACRETAFVSTAIDGEQLPRILRVPHVTVSRDRDLIDLAAAGLFTARERALK